MGGTAGKPTASHMLDCPVSTLDSFSINLGENKSRHHFREAWCWMDFGHRPAFSSQDREVRFREGPGARVTQWLGARTGSQVSWAPTPCSPRWPPDEMGFLQPIRLWGHHRCMGSRQTVVLDFTAFTGGTFSDLNLGRRSSRERPQQGSATAGCHVC